MEREHRAFAKEVISCFVVVLVFSILMIRPPEGNTQKVGVVYDKYGEPQGCGVCHGGQR